MGPRKDPNKPRGKMSSYAFFVQTCREEHKKKHPGENVVFAEFSKKCAAKWKGMGPKDKKRFEEMAEKDKIRYDGQMKNYTPPDGTVLKKKRGKKDPNAPKRALSSFFFFCNEERPAVRKIHPDYQVGDVAKELGKRWEGVTNRTKYEKQAEADKIRYAKAMAEYKKKQGGGAGAPSPKKAKVEKPVVVAVEEEDDDDEEEDDDDDDDDDEEEEESD